MQSRRYVAKYGAIRFLSCPGQAETVSKFHAISGAECKMPSPTPPKSAKVKLRACDFIDFDVSRHESNQALTTRQNPESRIKSQTLRRRNERRCRSRFCA